MITDEIKDRVARATVRLTAVGGQGVLVPGGYILTAAHCINWDGRGGMTNGDDYFIEPIETRDGTKLLAGPCAVEPMSDLAVLCSPDSNEYGDDWIAFEGWCEATEP